jgi:hypothetical protein
MTSIFVKLQTGAGPILPVHITERANIAETPTQFDFVIRNYFECVMNDVIFQD